MSLDLEAIRRRLDAATPGPWQSDCGEVYGENHGIWVAEALKIEDQRQSDADAEFIAHARTDVPALLEEIETLRRSVADLTKTGDEALDELGHVRTEIEQLDARANAAEQERDELRDELGQVKAERNELTKLAARLSRTLAGTDDRTADRPGGAT